ncbi:MAG TPA: penicillin-binding protein 2 [Candidatus Saccharimonadales bacterium]|nr:penicillin-binding protein 2 [Candidatus Saccharimonadales bacterium]
MQTVRPRRLRLLFALFAVASLVLAGRLAYWQTFGRAELLARATDQVRSDLVVAAHRGVIRDRSGAILATTVELRSLYALPKRIPDKDKAARDLGVLLGRDPGPIRAAFDSGAEWLYVQRWLPEATANAIAALNIPGLGFQNEPKRLYPNDAIGASVLGFVNDNGDGVTGIEGYYDAQLRGTDGRLVVERDPANRDLAVGLREAVAPRNGVDLTLTIDLVAQTAAERELAAAMKKEHATSGSVLVVDPTDGSIRALASAPTYDPAAVRVADPEALRDRAIAWPYEPGSTMKAVTIAAALNEKVVKPTDWYNDVGYTVVGGRRLNNALGKAYGPTTVTGILERSLNAGAAWVGQKLGAQRLSDYFSRFGFGKPTGVDLAGEVTGTVRPLAEWYPVDVGTASFGQGVSVSPLQLAMAYAALANGGTLFRPYVVASRRDADGEHRTAPVAVDQVVTPETAAMLRDMLLATVDDGIAHNASIAGFSIAGKTGTAQIAGPDGSYVDDQYVSSFAGFFPADDPKYVVLVVLEKPESRLLGTVTATDAFKGIAQDILRYARIQPDRRP